MRIERVQQIYEAIGSLAITLSGDPGALGPNYLQEQIATCRNNINNISQILLEVHREKHNLAAEIHTRETRLEIETDNLIVNDARISRLPHINDRKAAANLVLRDQVRDIAEQKAHLQNLEYVEKAVKHCHRELRDTMSEIRLQRSLIRDSIDTKSFYGDEHVTDPTADDVTVDQIDAMLQDVHHEQAAARARIEGPPSLDEDVSAESSLETVKSTVVQTETPKITPLSMPEDDSDINAMLLEGIDETPPAQVPPEVDPPAQAIPETLEAVTSQDNEALQRFLIEGENVGAAKETIVDDFADILDNL